MCPAHSKFDRSFEGEMEDEEGVGQVRLPTVQSDSAVGGRSVVVRTGSFAKRMRSYLQRKGGAAEQNSWRPIRHHRVAAKRWCVNIDAQIPGSTALSGLDFFRPFGISQGMGAASGEFGSAYEPLVPNRRALQVGVPRLVCGGAVCICLCSSGLAASAQKRRHVPALHGWLGLVVCQPFERGSL